MESSREDRWTDQDELILRAAERLRRGLRRDALTGLLQFSGSRWTEALDAVLPEFREHDLALSIVLTDLDQLGVINGNFGYRAGNEVLASVGQAFRELVRPLDMVFRGDGDGFQLLFLGADLSVATQRAELARATVEQLFIRHVPTGVTASFGVATHTGTEGPTQLGARAEQAFRRAKDLGRNRVEVAPPP